MKEFVKQIDYALLLPLVLVSTLGIIMLYSASSIVAITHYELPSHYFFQSQLHKLLIGGVYLFICMFIPFKFWKKRFISVCIVVFSITLLCLVLWKGKVVNNAQSWIFGIQPAEFTKLGMIIVVARFFAIRQELGKPYWEGIGKIILFLSVIFFLIYKQPNLGSALLIVATSFSIFFCSGISIKYLIKRILFTSVLTVPILYAFIKYGLSEVQMKRITTILNPFDDPQTSGYQLINSFIAIGSGGIIGSGFGNSIQKRGFLPEPHTDFIMAIISEELGFIGVFLILMGLLLLVIRALRISQKCPDLFGSLLAIGIGCMIGIQTIVNLGGITGIIPLTGTPLPFVSFGGSSFITNLIAVGILMNISKSTRLHNDMFSSNGTNA
ncbi:FtsW/RodA/SpoVE family cell cycle protein [Bacillus cytotoxicus]|uniref:Probable peptidoglycan glycosyltransferase FtsW n=2 Tax=Bacillus cytotoxicus TaxID=580165 RepID=A0AAX2CDC1_9BACI|nr:MULTISPECIES: FtsW/RodA/SpoVE family cell cycle protein [Bacillus cereus group]ABS21072.1 cell cycle protein [Bacillus cytotoxicus NVH 391-98]AWC46821.1 FtsW/RodA/SpoVE family cell cycle protein [Bacillus cytotoxicus]MDH2863981.1 FtsW/RodA/SpoVE family cell cycle protein [Bacillus cytotoxicus]MDH2881107.1 FtsW/RodA/SpoVE family cell cycle protein [Bacillus cytotoxicus]MDH2883623.1 FtsW/RodA/SpoVE family cell cycle protein [Bacillus cytotoxicus]